MGRHYFQIASKYYRLLVQESKKEIKPSSKVPFTCIHTLKIGSLKMGKQVSARQSRRRIGVLLKLTIFACPCNQRSLYTRKRTSGAGKDLPRAEHGCKEDVYALCSYTYQKSSYLCRLPTVVWIRYLLEQDPSSPLHSFTCRE